jgi:hypothetical protein
MGAEQPDMAKPACGRVKLGAALDPGLTPSITGTASKSLNPSMAPEVFRLKGQKSLVIRRVP